jgi:hypothetical protein
MDAMTRARETGQSNRTRLVVTALATVLLAGGVTALVARGAAADPVLPPLSAQELLTRVATAEVDGLSATVVQRSDLGLPALPAGLGEAGADWQGALGLLTGEHTFRVWQAGEDHSRVSLVDGDAETSLIRAGDQVWAWSSAEQEVGHGRLDPDAQHERPAGMPATPAEAATDLLDALEPDTDITTSGTGYVAGRAVYQLILSPRDAASLVGQVRVSVDAGEFVPLGLRVFTRDGSDAVSVTATSVDFAVPPATVFDFTPPPGAKVTEWDAAKAERPDRPEQTSEPERFGTGWTTVAVFEVDQKTDDPTGDDADLKALLESLPAVSGDWGSGRLLSTSLLNAVITDDGRAAVGSVSEDRLYAALAQR